MLSSSPSSSAVAASAEGENLTALHEYRDAVLVTSRKHLLKALIAESSLSSFLSGVQLSKARRCDWESVKTILEDKFNHISG